MARGRDVAVYAPLARLYYERDGRQEGGAELQTTLIARGLAERGLSVAHIVYPVRDPARQEPPSPALVERAPWQGGRRLGVLAEADAIWRGLHRADASVYIVRGSGGHLIPAAAFCRAMRRRLIFSTSNDLDFDFARPDRRPAILRVYRYSIRHADRVVVQTSQQERLAAAVLPEIEPLVIPSFSQPAEPSTAEPEYFLWVNRLVEYKEPERMLELATAVPEASFRMVISPTSETPQWLEERVRRAGEELPNLEVLDSRPRAQLLEEVSRAAAVVTTSRAEGMPNTFLEAWARGIPVLSLSVDPDARIADNDSGIVAGGSMERLAAGARTLWEDRDLRRRMGARGREFVRSTHSPDAVADRWVALVRELLGR
jgi:glycosyltransferase involved in cell wall biosynthesis